MEGKALQVLMQDMYPRDSWLWEATVDQVNRLTLGQAKKALQAQLGDLSNLQLDIASSAAPAVALKKEGGGQSMSHDEAPDADGAGLAAASGASDQAIEDMRLALEREVCAVLGDLPAGTTVAQVGDPRPAMAWSGCERRVHLPDADERALMFVAGGAPGYWGQGDATWEDAIGDKCQGWTDRCRADPAYAAMAMSLMAECMNTRLLSRLRDHLSLTYNCEIDVSMFEGFPGGFYLCRLFAAPSRLAAAAAAAVDVLNSPRQHPFMDAEVEASKKVMAYREGRDQRQRGYWVSKLRPLPDG